MNLVDLLIVLLVVGGASAGFGLGLVARVASWGGAVVGVMVAALVLPRVLTAVTVASTAARLLTTLLVFLVLPLIGGLLGSALGGRLRSGIRVGPGPIAGWCGGALAGMVGTLVLVWLLAPVAAAVPGVVAEQVRDSVITRALTGIAPPPPRPVQSLRSLVAQTRFPEVFTGLLPAPEVGPPPRQMPVSQQVLDRVTSSTVEIESLACQLVHEGSGWVADHQTVVTNAHVVAGTERLQVRRPVGGVLLPTTVISFDADRDLAVLRVPGLDAAPLPLGDPQPGTNGVVVGYPGGQHQPRPVPASIRRQVTADGRDIYGNQPVRREILFVAADVEHGDSGAPLADTSGNVVGVVFALAPDRPSTAFALTVSEVRAVLAGGSAQAGPCQ